MDDIALDAPAVPRPDGVDPLDLLRSDSVESAIVQTGTEGAEWDRRRNRRHDE